MSMQNGKELTNPTLSSLRSGRLSAEEALALHEQLECDALEMEGIVTPAMLCDRLRAIPIDEQPPLSSFELLCYRELEGELSSTELHELEEVCATFPRYAQLRDSILRTRLTIPTQVVFPNKERLKRKEVLVFAPILRRSFVAAAALILFVLLANSLFGPKPPMVQVAENLRPAPVRPVDAQQYEELEFAHVVLPKETIKNVSTTSAALPTLSTSLPDVEASALPLSEDIMSSQPEPLTNLTSIVAMASPEYELQIAVKSNDPAAFHDWETIMLNDEVAQFEEEMRALQQKLPPKQEPRFAVKVINFVITQLAKR